MSYILLIFLGIICVGTLNVQSFAQNDTKEIPTWVKGVANFWVDDLIDDTEFTEALEFLIDTNIIELGNFTYVSEQENDWESKYNNLLEVKTQLDKELSDVSYTKASLEEELEKEFKPEIQAYSNQVIELTNENKN